MLRGSGDTDILGGSLVNKVMSSSHFAKNTKACWVARERGGLTYCAMTLVPKRSLVREESLGSANGLAIKMLIKTPMWPLALFLDVARQQAP